MFYQRSGIGAFSSLQHLLICSAKTAIRSAAAFCLPIPLPRRMWAGGSLEFFAQIPVGATLTRQSTIDSIQEKEGRSGKLVFVTIRHEYWQEKTRAADRTTRARFSRSRTSTPTQMQRAPNPRGNTPPNDLTIPLYSQTLCGDAVTLFRFSALTFNSHRIHYDRNYAVNVEGYAGLVVHGPLLATQLAHFAEAKFCAERSPPSQLQL